MNKNGSTIFIILMMGVLLFILGLAMAKPLGEVINEAREDPLLDCRNSTISDQNKAVCTEIDMMQPMYIGVMFGLAGMLLGRIVLG